MMKEKYTKPVIIVVNVDNCDVITGSAFESDPFEMEGLFTE